MSEARATKQAAPLEIARTFADAYARGNAAAAAHLLHPRMHEQGVVAGGYAIDTRGRDAFIAETATFLAPYEKPEILHNSVEPVGPYFRWVASWRLRKGEETGVIEWHSFFTLEDGLITRLDVVCTGRVPEP